ncbi:MAG: TSCPD domain-containing protein [Nanoarchaeota archaeon]|nr:TSCPD domain-containing protein [Nanoarchaeota archaeon]
MVKIQVNLDEEEDGTLESFRFVNGCKSKEKAIKMLIKRSEDFQDVKECVKIKNKNKITKKK